MAAVSIEVEFIGGPQDGLTWAVPDLRSPYLIPIPDPGLTFAASTVPAYLCLVYEVELDPMMRRPSLSDSGRYRYRYTGTRGPL